MRLSTIIFDYLRTIFVPQIQVPAHASIMPNPAQQGLCRGM